MNIKEIKNKQAEENKQFTCSLVAYIAKVEELVASNQKPYLRILLQDKTGELTFQKWDATEEDKASLLVGSIVAFDNLVISSFNNTPQAKTGSRTTFSYSNEDKSNYILTIVPPVESLLERFKTHAASITNPELKAVLSHLVNPYFKDKRFINWPAAERMHHAVRHGLLYHTVGILDLVDAVSKTDNFKNMDIQLTKTAAILHDIGKIKEYDVDDQYNGKLSKYALIGHISMTSNEIAILRAQGIISEDLELILSHMILSHHEKKEYGSPVNPSFLEAYTLSMLDNLDAKAYVINFESLSLDNGTIADKGTFVLNNARLFKPNWRSERPAEDDNTNEDMQEGELNDLQEEEF